jgi:hypothetical protein
MAESLKQNNKRSSMKTSAIRLAVIFGVVLVVGLCAFVGWSYYETEKAAIAQARSTSNFVPDSRYVKEVGYIAESRVTRHIFEHKKEMIWWVKVPETDKVYSCSWEAGFNEYEKSEGVEIIHLPGYADADVWYGFIIGLHGEHKGKRTLVWALDNDVIQDILDDMK